MQCGAARALTTTTTAAAAANTSQHQPSPNQTPSCPILRRPGSCRGSQSVLPSPPKLNVTARNCPSQARKQPPYLPASFPGLANALSVISYYHASTAVQTAAVGPYATVPCFFAEDVFAGFPQLRRTYRLPKSKVINRGCCPHTHTPPSPLAYAPSIAVSTQTFPLPWLDYHAHSTILVLLFPTLFHHQRLVRVRKK